MAEICKTDLVKITEYFDSVVTMLTPHSRQSTRVANKIRLINKLNKKLKTKLT